MIDNVDTARAFRSQIDSGLLRRILMRVNRGSGGQPGRLQRRTELNPEHNKESEVLRVKNQGIRAILHRCKGPSLRHVIKHVNRCGLNFIQTISPSLRLARLFMSSSDLAAATSG